MQINAHCIDLLVILGPTATGKSDLAVRLAKLIAKKNLGGYKGAEIISADSRQVYRGLDIGSGKITKKEMRGVPHHLLDVVEPSERYTVMHFKSIASKAIADIISKGKLPIICGGTGFYIDALINNTNFPIFGADEALRKKLSTKTVPQLFKMLEKLDRLKADSLNHSDVNNPRRLIRAIEIATACAANTETNQWERKQQCIQYTPAIIGLKAPLSELRKRIHTRLLKRLKVGMVEEARHLHRPRRSGGSGMSWKRMEELGLEYRYEALHLQGKISRDQMLEKLEVEIGRYAKRQMTWFKRDDRIKWFSPAQFTQIDKYIQKVYNASKHRKR